MKTNPIDTSTTFTHNTRIFQSVKPTSYGLRITGHSPRNYDYDVYVDGNKDKTFYKLYYIMRGNRWVKSILRYFKDNKLFKEVRSVNRDEF